MDLKNKNILVTGGAGFIGSHLVDRLVTDNQVVVLDDFSTGKRENLSTAQKSPNLKVIEGDICNREQVFEVMKGVDVVFHLAISCLRTSLHDPVANHDINGGGTLNLCMAAHERGIERFVYCSSSEVYGTAKTVPMSESHPTAPLTVYGASKLVGEHYTFAHGHTYGMPVVVVRPFNTYGPREPYEGSRAEVIPRFTLLLKSGRQPVVYGDGQQTRDFTFVEETAKGLQLAAESDALLGKAVNIARGEEVSILRIGELLMELTGTQEVGLRHEADRPGDVHRHYADAGQAQKLLGFRGEVDIRRGLERFLQWFDAEDLLARTDLEKAAQPNW